MSLIIPSIGRFPTRRRFVDGLTPATAGLSALEIKLCTGTRVDGLYWIQPRVDRPAQQVWCDMNTDGGGWMLIARTHPGGSVAAGTWGWRGSALGGVTDFTQPYQLGWFPQFHAYGATFKEFIYGNRKSPTTNEWGPFIYRRRNLDGSGNAQQAYTRLISTDDSLTPGSFDLLKYDTIVYNWLSFPNMQMYIGESMSSQTINLYHMRDMAGASAGYGITPSGMVTTYINHAELWYLSGPWYYDNETDGGGNFLQDVPGSDMFGGSRQVMLMVR